MRAITIVALCGVTLAGGVAAQAAARSPEDASAARPPTAAPGLSSLRLGYTTASRMSSRATSTSSSTARSALW
jgi:hypothetical protein